MELLMKAAGIVTMILFGFVVPGVAAQQSQPSPASPERDGALGQSGASPAQFAGPQTAEQTSGSSQAQPETQLRRFSLPSGTSIDASTDCIAREHMLLPVAP